jgi:shikimate dehydrogenase
VKLRAKADTRLFALLGDPVAHSLSPLLQGAALQALALDGIYVALRCSAADCPHLLQGIARAGGGGNVTIPHKERAAGALEFATEWVNRTGACNTYWFEHGQVCGDNTDVEGFSRAVQRCLGDIRGAHVLLLGAGGGARAVVAGLTTMGVARIDVLARSHARAERLASLVGPGTTTLAVASGQRARCDLVINATPLGLDEQDPLPYPVEQLHPGSAVFDLVYRPSDTAWVRAARAAGLRAVDGKEMLLYQAAAAFERWWRRDPPVEAMRAALRGAVPG